MRIKYDFNNMMSNVIGDEHGISEEIINTFSGKTKEIDLKLKEKRKRGEIQFFDLPYQKDIVKDINDYADYVSSRFCHHCLCFLRSRFQA
jgi:glucose-6-phosphate isomerase